MSVKSLEHFFKPEIRSSGSSLYAQGKVSIKQPSDTEIVAYIKTTPPLKVSLKTKDIASPTLYADCNCPVGKKNLFCKHIWATLLLTEENFSDFLEEKTHIENMATLKETLFKPQQTAQSKAWEEKQITFQEKQAAYKQQQKEKQSLYRKIQYQKQKLRSHQFKKDKIEESIQPKFPLDVEKSLAFFSQNGFDLTKSLTQENINVAKKKLARIFHPDKGGTHEEILELISNSDILLKFAKQLSKK